MAAARRRTKALLYKDPGLVKGLDDFFNLARITSRTANPSGTAHAMQAGQTVAAVGGMLTGTVEPMTAALVMCGPAAVSKFLHSQTGVRLLTKGYRIPLGNRAAVAAYSAELAKFAREAGIATSPNGFQTPSPAPAR